MRRAAAAACRAAMVPRQLSTFETASKYPMTAPLATLARGSIRASPAHGFGRRAYSPNPLPGEVLNGIDPSRMARPLSAQLLESHFQSTLAIFESTNTRAKKGSCVTVINVPGRRGGSNLSGIYEPLSNFASNFNLQLYIKEGAEAAPERVKFDRHAPRARRCKLTRRNQCMESSQDGRTPKSRSTVTDISLCERP